MFCRSPFSTNPVKRNSHILRQCPHSYAVTREYYSKRTNFLQRFQVRAVGSKQKKRVSAGERTAYDVLGVHEDASTSDIKAAYRRLASKLHPDVAGSKGDRAQASFQLVLLAYAALSNPSVRQAYDTHGAAALAASRYDALRKYLISPDGQQAVGVKGKDVFVVISIALAEAARGVERQVVYNALVACRECKGSGLEAGYAFSCDVCAGTGSVLKSTWTGTAGLSVLQRSTCPACNGSGSAVQERCSGCLGEGRASVSRALSARIPAGVSEATVLRYAGVGDAGRAGGPAGDLYLKLEITPDPGMLRVGDDLHSDLPLRVWDAVTGGAVRVQTVRGEAMLQVPPGTQHGDVLELEGAGVARALAGAVVRGKHCFRVQLRVPVLQAPAPPPPSTLSPAFKHRDDQLSMYGPSSHGSSTCIRGTATGGADAAADPWVTLSASSADGGSTLAHARALQVLQQLSLLQLQQSHTGNTAGSVTHDSDVHGAGSGSRGGSVSNADSHGSCSGAFASQGADPSSDVCDVGSVHGTHWSEEPHFSSTGEDDDERIIDISSSASSSSSSSSNSNAEDGGVGWRLHSGLRQTASAEHVHGSAPDLTIKQGAGPGAAPSVKTRKGTRKANDTKQDVNVLIASKSKNKSKSKSEQGSKSKAASNRLDDSVVSSGKGNRSSRQAAAAVQIGSVDDGGEDSSDYALLGK